MTCGRKRARAGSPVRRGRCEPQAVDALAAEVRIPLGRMQRCGGAGLVGTWGPCGEDSLPGYRIHWVGCRDAGYGSGVFWARGASRDGDAACSCGFARQESRWAGRRPGGQSVPRVWVRGPVGAVPASRGAGRLFLRVPSFGFASGYRVQPRPAPSCLAARRLGGRPFLSPRHLPGGQPSPDQPLPGERRSLPRGAAGGKAAAGAPSGAGRIWACGWAPHPAPPPGATPVTLGERRRGPEQLRPPSFLRRSQGQGGGFEQRRPRESATPARTRFSLVVVGTRRA